MTTTVLDPALPNTTAEEDRYTAQARRINMIWEVTQALVAAVVVSAYTYAALYLPEHSSKLDAAFFLVIGFYFGRTNHARTGGVG